MANRPSRPESLVATDAGDSRSVAVEVVCEGSSWERGLAQGETLREKIVATRELLEQLEAFRLRQPAWMPFGAYRWLCERKARRFLEAALADGPGEIDRQLAGMAQGAGLGAAAIDLLHALEPVLCSVDEISRVPATAACSAVAVRGSRSTSGEPIIARNFDYLPITQPFYILRESRPKGGFRSIDFTLAPLCGAVDGMNEHGLCITNNYAFAADEQRPAATISMLIAEALGRCKTVSEAAESIASQQRSGAGLLMLADAQGDVASLELSNTRSSLRRPPAGEDYLFHSNAYATETMRQVQAPDEAAFDDRAPKPLRGQRVLQSSEQRDRRFTELLAKPARFGVDELAALMADHGRWGTASADTICMHSDYWYTTASLQFLPRARRIRVAYASTCRARFTEIEL